MRTPVSHDFQECLERSQQYADAPWWEEVYRKAFVGFLAMHCIRKDGWAQRGGIDRIILLKGGKQITIDEKVREKDYGDILLERWSDKEKRKPGWVQKDLACDYIAYAVAPSRKCYLLPVLQLQRSWADHGHKWIAKYGTKDALNRHYTTANVPVPVDVLFAAIQDAMMIEWAQ